MYTGTIYAIRSPSTNKIYIGSTKQHINKRLQQHIAAKTTTSKLITDYNDCYIEPLELFECESRKELCKKEGDHIKANIENVVNKVINGSTPKESYTRYQNNNREWYREYAKQWRKENPNYYIERKKKKDLV